MSAGSEVAEAQATPGPRARRDTAFHALRVSAVERLTDEAVAVTFDVPADLAAAFMFEAGQHVTVRIELDGQEHRRSYSICASACTQTLRIAVKQLPGGVVSGFLTAELQPGDVLDVMPPLGHFGIGADPACPSDYAAVCAGSGITPVLSLIATTLEREPGSRYTLVYGNRTGASVMFLEELADLKNLYLDRLQIFHVLSREAPDVELLAGRIDVAKLTRIFGSDIGTAADIWYLCGPIDLVETVRTALLDAGQPERRIRTEIFHVDGEPVIERFHVDPTAADAVATVTATLGGRSSTFEHRRGAGSLLDSMLSVRSDVPFSCKGGVCGTCRARLTDGGATMARHYALERDEIDAGFILACQAQPTTERLALDFDQ